MSQDSEQISTLEDLFKSDLQKPFHYKLSLVDINNSDREIFESIRKIFMTGLQLFILVMKKLKQLI